MREILFRGKTVENEQWVEGWWEYKHYNGDDEHNHCIDDEVTHWMPLPQPPKEGE